MDAFGDIGRMGSANLAVVAPGISEALITTAMGSSAAIPAAVFFNFFTSRVKVLRLDGGRLRPGVPEHRRAELHVGMQAAGGEAAAARPRGGDLPRAPLAARLAADARRDQRHPARGRGAGAAAGVHGHGADDEPRHRRLAAGRQPAADRRRRTASRSRSTPRAASTWATSPSTSCCSRTRSARSLEGRPDSVVYLRADEGLRYGQVIRGRGRGEARGRRPDRLRVRAAGGEAAE